MRLPLLTPFNSSTPKEIEAEVERRLEDGFRTFKIKVGKDAGRRSRSASKPSSGRSPAGPPCGSTPTAPFPKPMRAALRSALDPSGIELFEQPCRAEDWDANAHVGKGLHRSHHAGRADLRARGREARRRHSATWASASSSSNGLAASTCCARRSMRCANPAWSPVLGDGLSSELGCWMEACVARVTIRNAGEFNGFLKPKTRLFAEPLRFTAGELVLSAGLRADHRRRCAGSARDRMRAIYQELCYPVGIALTSRG